MIRILGCLVLFVWSFCPQGHAMNSDTLIVGVNHSPPFILQNEAGHWEGISIWLWENIANDLRLPYRYEEGTLDEILEKLKAKELHLSINPMTVTSDRHRYIDFSLPFYVSHSSMAVKTTSTWQRVFAFIESFFSLNFWRVILALFIVILFFGFLTWLFERKENPEQFEAGAKGLWSGVWWSAVTMTTVGYGDKSPKSTGGRIIALIWMFTAIIIISGFTASIASSLTVNQLSWNQENFQDFKEKNVGTIGSSSTAFYLQKHFFRDIQFYNTLSDGLSALEQEDIDALAYDEPILRYTVQRDSQHQNLEVLPLQFDLQFYAFSFPENSGQLRDTISSAILSYTERQEWQILLAEYDLKN